MTFNYITDTNEGALNQWLSFCSFAVWYWVLSSQSDVLVVCLYYAPKKPICIPCFIVQSKKFIKESLICSKYKKTEWRCPVLVSLVSLNSIFLKRRLSYFEECSYFQLLSIKFLSFSEQDVSILKNWSSCVEKEKWFSLFMTL